MKNNFVFFSNWFAFRAQRTLFLIKSKSNLYYSSVLKHIQSLHLKKDFKVLAAVCLQNVGSFSMYSASNSKSLFQNPNGGTILNSHVCNLKLINLETRISKNFDNFLHDWLTLGHCILLVNHQINQEMQLI